MGSLCPILAFAFLNGMAAYFVSPAWRTWARTNILNGSAGRRSGISQQAYASFDEVSANYRQTSLTAYQQVEDNLVALRILSQEAIQQRQATVAAQGAEQIFNNRYVGGLDTYLQVVTAQNAALANERNEIDIMRRRMDASVLLIKALGGGWSTAQLPNY